jgi:gliding motility-associated-like protein
MKRTGILLIISLLLTFFGTQKAFSQYGPGGVGDMTNTQLWLKSDSLIAILPTFYVTGWFDQSGQSHDFQALTMGQAVPSLTENSINGFPAVTFTESAKQYLGYNGSLNITGSGATTVAIVARNTSSADEPNGGLYIGKRNVGGADAVRDYGLEYNDAVRFNGENQIFNDGHGQGEWNIIIYSNPAGSTVANYKAWLNGTQLTGSSSSSTVPALPASGLFALLGATQMGGSYNNAGFFDGDLVEIAAFSSELNDASRVVLENNLAARYHLDIADDHYAYQDTYYWDVSGIAAVNGTTFTNAWSSDLLSINSPTNLSDNEYLFFGNDHKQVTAWTTTGVPASGSYRLSRQWAVDETGDVGTVTLSIPASSLPTFPSGYFRVGILTDSDGDFTSGATLHEAFINGSNYEVSLNLTAGTYMTIVCFRPEISFTTTSASGLESVSSVTMNFSLNYPFTVAQSADYSVTGGTATNGTDYNLPAGTVTFAPGQVSKSVSFTVVNDLIVEGNETAIVSLSNPSAEVTLGTNDTYTYTIIDDDALYVSFSAATASENEGNATRSVATPTLTLSGAILPSPASVTLTVTNGTATSDDWSQTNAVITIPAGNYTSATQISIPSAALSILGDNVVENDETINLNLNSFVIATAGAITNCTYTIVNDDNATVSVAATTASVTEGGPGPAGTGTFTFSLTNPCATARTVTYSVSGTATSGTDYVALPGTITFPANTTSITTALTTIPDLLVEGDETVSLKITAISGTPAVSIDATPAVMTITDDDVPSIQYSPSSISMAEGSTATIDVWLGSAPLTPVVLNISTVKSGVITLNKVTLTFTTANYATPQTVTVTSVDDNMMGNLSDDVIISVNDASSDDHFDPLADVDIPVTIINNDIAALVISPTSLTIAENATGTFTVALSAGPSAGNVVVDLVSNDLTVAAIDKAQLIFTAANWNVAQTVTVTGVNNNIIPNTSTTISLAVNNALSDDDFDGKTGTVTINVTNDDVAGFTVSPLTLNLNEGGPAGSFTIVLNAQPTSDVVFDLVNASPVYVTTVSQVTFTSANWNVPQTVIVTPIEDALDLERTDYVVVTVNKASTDDNFDAMASQTVTINITDNDPPIITGCPSNITTGNTTGNCSAVVSWTAPTSTSPMVSDHNPGETFPKGTTTVTYTSTDAEGMVSTCIFTVTVNDTEAPKITCPANLSGISPDAGKCYATGVSLGTPTTSDNCGIASVVNNAPVQFPVGTTSVDWTVTDNAGLTATCTQTVKVVDNIAPTITCPANVTVNTDAGSCSATGVALGTPTYSDNCTGSTVTNNAPASFPKGITNVTWTVTDAAGLTASCIQTVTVTDNVPPTITCPANLNISADAGKCYASSVSLGLPTTADNCSVASVTNNAPAQFPIGTTTVTWTVTDGSGLTATCTQTVKVTDTQAPVITCPANKAGISPDAGKCYATSVSLGMPTTSDNCAVASVTNNAPVQFPVGTTTVTWTVTDVSGLTSTCNQTVTVVDNIAPTITCPSNLSGITPDAGKCYATGVSLGLPATSDNCSVASVTNNAPAQFPVGTTTVTWTVTDASGLTATCTQTVTVADNLAPTITCPANLTGIGTDAGKCYATGVSLGTPVTSDNCTVASVTNNAPVQFPIGTTTVIWTVKDNSGNTSTCNQTVTVVDSQLPSIICPPNKTLISADPGKCYATGVALGNATTSDNCGVASVTNNAPAQFPVGTTTVTWTVTDTNGNTATCNQTVTVVDTEAPHIICPSSLTDIPADASSCQATGVSLGTPITSDNCGIQSVTNNAPAAFPVGITTVIWTALDVHNNTATCVQTVEVLDLTAPTITCPPDLSGILADAGSCYASGVSLGTPVTSDNCGVASVTNDAPAQFPVGTTTVTWTVTDNAGLSSTCTQTVQVIDNQVPVITCPSNLSAVPVDAGLCYANGVSLGSPVVSDNCGTPIVSNDAPVQFPVGTTTVTWTATDAGGLTSSCAQTVTVVDTQLPVITCPANITGLAPDAGTCYATGVSLGIPVTSDNCGVATVTNNAPAQYPIGTTTVTWTVTDVNGLVSTCNQTVQVVDSEAPVITCPADITGAAPDAGMCYATGIPLGTPVTSDNCGVASVTNNAPATYPIGTTVVTWTVKDNSGLTATCTQNVQVVDSELPTITCPAAILDYMADINQCYASGISLGLPVTSDNCGVASVTNDAPTQFPVGTNTITWTVTDVNGSTNTCAQTVEIIDTQSPQIICPGNMTITSTPGICGAVAPWAAPFATDNCPGLVVTSNFYPGDILPLGVTTVNYLATDASGNTATCSFKATVKDTEAPTIVPNDTIFYLDITGSAAITYTDVTDTVYDHCALSTVTLSKSTFNCSNIGTNNVTITAKDNAGNTATAVAVVTIADTISPVLTCKPAIAYIDASGNATITPADVIGSLTDNCSTGTTSVDKSSFTCADLGDVAVTVTAADSYGNTSKCSTIVTVTDTLSVKVSAGPDIAVCLSDASVKVTSSWVYNGSVLWSTSGDGTFDDPTSVNPTYTFGSADAAGVTLTVTATKINGCTSTVSDATAITYISNPVISAGSDKTLCTSDVSYTLSEATTTGGTVKWSTSGDGSFNDVNTLNPVYTFGAADLAGSVTLTMTVTAGTCPPLTDDMLITFVASATASAGLNGSICASATGFQVTGASHTGGSVMWATSGDGTFNNNTIDNPYYTLGAADTKSASVTLTMTVTGTGTCGTVSSANTLTIFPIPGISIISHNNISCNGSNDGVISVIGLNGTPSYSYSIDGSAYQTSGVFDYLTPGDHIISVMDLGGCPVDTTIKIIEPDVFTFAVDNVINIACYGESTGAINVTATGGTTPYSFSWTGPDSFTSTSEDLTGLSAGTYSLSVTDANSCITFTVDKTITEGNQIVVVIDTISNRNSYGVTCNGSADGFINTTVTGGAGTLALEWTGPESFIATTDDISGLVAGSYIFSVTDTVGCVVATTINITQPDSIDIVADVKQASCPDVSDGGINITTSGGSGTLAFLWSDGSTDQNRSNIKGGDYTVAVTDENGCVSHLTVTVDFTGYNCIVIPTIITPNGDGQNEKWIIKNAELYPDIDVKVYTRWGKLVYSSRNPNANPWDGTYQGNLLPNDSYHYIIRLNDGTQPRSGVISVISK